VQQLSQILVQTELGRGEENNLDLGPRENNLDGEDMYEYLFVKDIYY